MNFEHKIIRCIDLKVYNTNIEKLFSLCMYKADSEKVKLLFDQYVSDSNKDLYLYKESEAYVGLIGIEVLPRKVIIGHIATEKKRRSKGLASNLIDHVMSQYPSMTLEAETDDDAVMFYKKTGFDIKSLGEKYPGFPRYSCSK